MKKQTRHHRGRKKKTVTQIIMDLFLIIAVGVFVFSGFKLYGILVEYNKGEREYTELQRIAIEQKVPTATEETSFAVDFEALKTMNKDVVGWIRFDEPAQINYPVVRTTDNEKYLNTTFEGKKNAAGALFVDYCNAEDFTDKNTFIYGHNMKNGSMFGQLRKYKNNAFCEEHPYFYIYTQMERNSNIKSLQ